MSKAIVNTFKKLDTDTSQNKQDNSSFYDAQDLRLISDEPLSNGALVNYKGTKAKINIGTNKVWVRGYSQVGNTLVLLLHTSNQTNPAQQYSSIASVKLTETNEVQNITTLYKDLLSVNKLGFNTVSNIEVIGRYENPYSRKIYFAVPNMPLRVFNISEYIDTTLDYSVDRLDILPDSNGANISIPDSFLIPGGKLESGKIQYSCRLFNKYGAETTFSPCSDIISITSSNANGVAEFKGSDIEINSGKSVKINISLSNNHFKYIRIYSIHYKVKDIPVISLVGEIKIPLNYNSFNFIDNGTILDSITLEEFNIFGGNLISAETIGTKNNILFAANTKEISNTISLDCRAYRFNITNNSKVFDSNGDYYIINSIGGWTKYDSNDNKLDTGDDWSIPETADCINYYNDEFKKDSGTLVHPYLYDRDVSGVYGGTGKIVSYVIKSSDNYVTLVDGGDTIVNSSNINFILKEKSFKQGETYRIGLNAYDLKGKPYFTNWVGDIRIPYFSGASDVIKSTEIIKSGTTTGVEMKAKYIYIEFSVNLDNIDIDVKNKISSIHFSMVDRTQFDKSVISQGCTMAGATYDFSAKAYEHNCKINRATSFPGIIKDEFKIHPFISPEFNINGGISVNGELRLMIVKILSKPVIRRTTTISGSTETHTYSNATYTETIKFASRLFYPTTNILDGSTNTTNYATLDIHPTVVPGVSFDVNSNYKMTITEKSGQKVTLSISSGDVKFSNRVFNTDDGHTMYGPTCEVFSSTFALPNDASTQFSDEYGYTYILDLYINNASSRYGGDTYNNRILNEYIKCSDISILNGVHTGTININASGDIYNTVFDTLVSISDPNVEDGGDDLIGGSLINRRQIVALLPLESSINCFLTGSKPSKYIDVYPSGQNKDSKFIGLTETKKKGIELYGDRYPNVGDFNSYNTAYSSNSKYPTFFPKPNLFEEISVNQNTIYASEIKVNGEYIDNWSKFLYANLLEVEGVYGAIHKLTTLDNKLYFFQEEAIGIAAVNDRYIIGQGDAAKLSLGTGTVLERFDYVKYNEGIIKPEHVINTITNLYFIDHNRKVLDIVGNSDIALSIEKGVNTLFRQLYIDSSTPVTIGFDPVFREVLFTIGSEDNIKTIVYNENVNAFQPRSSATPLLFLNISDGLLSFKKSLLIPTGISNYIYKHNAGNIGELYSEANTVAGTTKYYSDSYVSILVNTNTPTVFVADNVEFRTEVRDYNINKSIFDDKASYNNIPNSTLQLGTYGDDLKTVDKIEFKNSYQYKLQNTIVKQDYRNSVIGVIPNTSRRHRSWTTAVPMFKDTTTGNNTRFIDTFLSMTFTFNNGGNKVFKLHDITTYIRPTHK